MNRFHHHGEALVEVHDGYPPSLWRSQTVAGPLIWVVSVVTTVFHALQAISTLKVRAVGPGEGNYWLTPSQALWFCLAISMASAALGYYKMAPQRAPIISYLWTMIFFCFGMVNLFACTFMTHALREWGCDASARKIAQAIRPGRGPSPCTGWRFSSYCSLVLAIVLLVSSWVQFIVRLCRVRRVRVHPLVRSPQGGLYRIVEEDEVEIEVHYHAE